MKSRRSPKTAPEISVIITTRNRTQQLLQCLQALSSHSMLNSVLNFEVIVIDQSDENQSDLFSKKFAKKFLRFRYIPSMMKGRSRGLNIAIAHSMGHLLAITDDDCIPDRNWLISIKRSFDNFPSISGVCGRTKPYQPGKHQRFFCPCTFTNKNPIPHMIQHPCNHWEWIGYGNNVAFRRIIFTQLGGFKEWLGVGSIGRSAEDAEIVLRALVSGKKLFYDPQAVVHHNRWITPHESKVQNLSYLCGEVACYGYFALQGHSFAKEVIKNNFKHLFRNEARQLFSSLFYLQRSIFPLTFWWVAHLVALSWGAIIASYFFISEKVMMNKSPLMREKA